MLIRPATLQDRGSMRAILEAHGWGESRIDAGDAFVAVDAAGAVVGCLRLVDCPPEGVYVADVVVREDLRGGGIGARLMDEAMATRSGPFFLVCHPERLGFYGRLGFADATGDSWGPEIVACSRAEGDWESDHLELHHHLVRPA